MAEVFAYTYTHARIDDFMRNAGIECDEVPTGNKIDKVRAWLKVSNQSSSEPLAALGKVITEFMEVDGGSYDPERGEIVYPGRDRVKQILSEYGLSYRTGGYIVATGVAPLGRTFEDVIHSRDLTGLQTEYDRIYLNVETDPAAALTASCALLESLFTIYIQDHDTLTMPTERSIKPLWKVIRKDLNFDPAVVGDDDLKTILSGLAAIVEGIGSLRTHKGSAHGQGKKAYKIKPRHARLAAHASFTLAGFVLEAWDEQTP